LQKKFPLFIKSITPTRRKISLLSPFKNQSTNKKYHELTPKYAISGTDPFSRIAQARIQAGLTQQQLADKLGTTQRVVTYWEREAVGLRADQLTLLTEVLGVSADYFLGRKNKVRSSGPAGKARLMFERVSQLPRFHQQRILSTVEDMLIAQRAKSSG